MKYQEKKKILVIFGTRPEAIKLAPVISECKKQTAFETIVCSTGQHREMLKQVLDIFAISPDHDLDIMKPNQDLFDVTTGALLRLRDYFMQVRPDIIVVQGDTTTAFAAALAAFYLKIKVAHVEAALRSYNIYSPFPEEANRRFISVVSDYNFAPTEYAARNLLREKFRKESVYVTGNTVVDALLQVKKIVDKKEISVTLREQLRLPDGSDILKKKYVLITLHRREKFGEEFSSVLGTISKLALEYPEINFIYPVHLNPNVQKPVLRTLQGISNIFLLPPQDYLSFVYLMKKCHFIISDSGGIQEECYTFRKPILVLRDVTERMEAVIAGYAFLLGSDRGKIHRTFRNVYKKLSEGHNFFPPTNPYGDGKSAVRITRILRDALFLKGE